MDLVISLLANEQVVDLLANVATIVVGALITKVGLDTRGEILRSRAKDAVMAGVQELQPIAREFKAANENHKLTSEQRDQLKESALSSAQGIGVAMGVNVAKVLGPQIINAVLERSVRDSKPQKKTMSDAVESFMPLSPKAYTEGEE